MKKRDDRKKEEAPHTEKSTMPEPQEEFINENPPSRVEAEPPPEPREDGESNPGE